MQYCWHLKIRRGEDGGRAREAGEEGADEEEEDKEKEREY